MFLRTNRNVGWIGVDIGTQSIKLAQVAATGKKMEVQAAAIVPRVNAWHYDLSQLKEGISSAGEIDVSKQRSKGFSGKQSAATISMAVCDVRRISMPDQSNLTFEQLVQNELASIERFKGLPRQFEYWETERAFSDTGPPANVLSVPEFWTKQCMSDLQSSGLDCQQLDGIPFSLARAFSLFEDSEEPIALLDWGYSRATMCIVQNGYPKFVRMLRRSGYRFVMEEIGKGFELDPEMARIVASKYGLEDSSENPSHSSSRHEEKKSIQQTLHDFVLEPINVIAKEVNRTIRFLENQQKALMPSKLVLFGGGATLRNVAPLLESKVRMPTEIWGEDIAVKVPDHLPLAVLSNAIAMSAVPFIESAQRKKINQSAEVQETSLDSPAAKRAAG